MTDAALTTTDPAYWQALIDSGYLAQGLAALATPDKDTVHWTEVQLSGTMNYLRVKEDDAQTIRTES